MRRIFYNQARISGTAGYLTGLSGKWHLGKEPGQLPHERGFDFFFGFDRAHVEKYGSERLLKNEKHPAVAGCTPKFTWLVSPAIRLNVAGSRI